jgi:hypothetical protein
MVLPVEKNNKLALESLPSYYHSPFHLPLAKPIFLFPRKEQEPAEGLTDSLRRLHGQQTTLSKQ